MIFYLRQNIDDILGFLNTTIKYTDYAKNITKIGSIVGLASCTAAQFKHKYDLIGLNLESADDINKYEEANRELFRVCDRVACLTSPDKCEAAQNLLTNSDRSQLLENSGYKKCEDCEEGGIQIGEDYYSRDDDSRLRSSRINLENGKELFNSDDELIGRIENIRTLGDSCTTSDGKPGIRVEISGTQKTRENAEASLGIFSQTTFVSTRAESTQCIDLTEINNDEYIQNTFSNFGQSNSVCYTKEDPFYHDTRAWWPGMDEGFSNNDPKRSIYHSVRGACITDTYSHISNLLTLQQGIYECLEQVKMGVSTGGYCQRLMAQAVCDILTNTIYPAAVDAISKSDDSESQQRDLGFDFVESISRSQKVLDDRYQGTIFDRSNLGGSNLYHKACLFAFTGDTSLLLNDMFSSLDRNQVDPIIGPPLPESRVDGYNPLTGDLTITYRYTHGLISGGSNVQTHIEFFCDPNAPNGDYCAENVIISTETHKDLAKFVEQPQTVGQKQSVNINYALQDTNAKYWFNKMRFKYDWIVNNEPRQKIYEFEITHKGEVPNSCYFNAIGGLTIFDSSGFNCETLSQNGFDDSSLASRFTLSDETDFFPKQSGTAIYFPGEEISLSLGYDIQGSGSALTANLHYGLLCEQNLEIEPRVKTIDFELDDLTNTGSGKKIVQNLLSIDENILNMASSELKLDFISRGFTELKKEKTYTFGFYTKRPEEENYIPEGSRPQLQSDAQTYLRENGELLDFGNQFYTLEETAYGYNSLTDENIIEILQNINNIQIETDTRLKKSDEINSLELFVSKEVFDFVDINNQNNQITLSESDDLNDINFQFKPLSDEPIYLVIEEKGNSNVYAVFEYDPNLNLKCDIYLRLLTEDRNSFESVEALKEYTYEDADSDIITNTRDDFENEYVKLGFKINEEGEVDRTYSSSIELIKPQNKRVYCESNQNVEFFKNGDGDIENMKITAISKTYGDKVLSSGTISCINNVCIENIDLSDYKNKEEDRVDLTLRFTKEEDGKFVFDESREVSIYKSCENK